MSKIVIRLAVAVFAMLTVVVAPSGASTPQASTRAPAQLGSAVAGESPLASPERRLQALAVAARTPSGRIANATETKPAVAAMAEAQPGESDRSDMGMMILVAIAMVATVVVKGSRS